MTDLLRLAREKSGGLSAETEELSAVIESAERFFHGIVKYYPRLLKDVEELDEFLATAGMVSDKLRDYNKTNLKELQKIFRFIQIGEELVREVEGAQPINLKQRLVK